MTAFIYLDAAAMRPVIGGVWHLTRLSAIPAPGGVITMLCNKTAASAFGTLSERSAHGVPTQCLYCDFEYRRIHGYEIPPNHPGLRTPPRRS
ncbi:hypothetical protein [Amycolatopsis jiangsuensis]|uniref:Uncharacterized protein n=1 Tax=Amycolatopsis jiangsuensis TaxID=1181879 RepID=A0A840J8H3_9PSEU|nr:hypothetical protein [Amycolatopsis jiangsuensis]MBB4689688.1 hypothetical protein [Amycolatopsis jiangsuensis]